MKGLFLSGYGCRPWIWEKIKKIFDQDDTIDVKYIEWPVDLISEFHNLNQFSTWLADNFIREHERYDFLVGHSMGGLIALNISTMDSVNIRDIILVEAFIQTPPAFFRNILMENTNAFLKERVLTMLQHESKYYSPKLMNQLRHLNLTDLIISSNSSVHCVYGDRGVKDPERVLHELNLPLCIRDRMDIHIIQNSCHFPMLENSNFLATVLKTILEA